MAFPATTLLDDFKRTENPLSNGGKWTQLGWASAIGKCFSEVFGWVSTTGGGSGEELPSGCYWNVAAFTEPAVSVRQYQEEGSDLMGIWACTTGAGTKNGYRLKVKFVAGSTIAMTLERWVAGVKTELGKVEFAVGIRSHETAYGLTVAEGKVKGWYGATEAGMAVKLEAEDATFTTGKVGIEDNKVAQNGMTDFRAASQEATHTHTLSVSQPQTIAKQVALARTVVASQAQVTTRPANVVRILPTINQTQASTVAAFSTSAHEHVLALVASLTVRSIRSITPTTPAIAQGQTTVVRRTPSRVVSVTQGQTITLTTVATGHQYSMLI